MNRRYRRLSKSHGHSVPRSPNRRSKPYGHIGRRQAYRSGKADGRLRGARRRRSEAAGRLLGRDRGDLLAPGAAHIHVAERIEYQFRTEGRGNVQIFAGGDDLIDDEARLIAGELEAVAGLQLLDHQRRHVVGHLDAALRCDQAEDAAIFLAARRLDLQLVGNTAQEGRIHEVVRLQVGREHDDLVERNREGLAGVELQEVDTAFQLHDPAVQELLGLHQLTAEVVDDEGAAERLHVQRRLVVLRAFVVAQIQHFQREFAAGDDDRALAGHIAAVERLLADGIVAIVAVRRFHFLVDRRVVDLDDLAVDLDGEI